MIRNYLLLFSLLIVCGCSSVLPAQDTKAPNDKIQWLSIQDALRKSKSDPKKIFVDVYTSWCGWCKKMDKSTFEDPAVVSYVNVHFYPVKFDAETRDTISYREKTFSYLPDYKSNELAAVFLNGQMSYPTSVYLDEQSNLIGPVPGFLDANQFLVVVKFFGDDIYKTKKWEDYIRENFSK